MRGLACLFLSLSPFKPLKVGDTPFSRGRARYSGPCIIKALRLLKGLSGVPMAPLLELQPQLQGPYLHITG